MRPPLVGITAGSSAEAPGFYLLRWDYVHALAAVGVIPVILTPGRASRSREFLDPFAGVILSGGGDLDPALAGQPTHPLLRGVNRERDEFEMEIAERALERGIPILGICRGMQLLNVLLGGDLIQDLPERVGHDVSHDDAARARDILAHPIHLAPPSRLARIFQRVELEVNSFHHQGLDRLGTGLEPVAWSTDGVIEAVERPGEAFVVGVQWHPESLWQRGWVYLALFDAVREAAVRYRGNGWH